MRIAFRTPRVRDIVQKKCSAHDTPRGTGLDDLRPGDGEIAKYPDRKLRKCWLHAFASARLISNRQTKHIQILCCDWGVNSSVRVTHRHQCARERPPKCKSKSNKHNLINTFLPLR